MATSEMLLVVRCRGCTNELTIAVTPGSKGEPPVRKMLKKAGMDHAQETGHKVGSIQTEAMRHGMLG